MLIEALEQVVAWMYSKIAGVIRTFEDHSILCNITVVQVASRMLQTNPTY